MYSRGVSIIQRPDVSELVLILALKSTISAFRVISRNTASWSFCSFPVPTASGFSRFSRVGLVCQRWSLIWLISLRCLMFQILISLISPLFVVVSSKKHTRISRRKPASAISGNRSSKGEPSPRSASPSAPDPRRPRRKKARPNDPRTTHF